MCCLIWRMTSLGMKTSKGVFNIRPTLPRYAATWDATKVFTFINSKPTVTDCDLKPFSHRLAILLRLTTGQRDQTINCLKLDYIEISSDKVVLFVPKTLKTTGSVHHLPTIELNTFKDIELCVVTHLRQYIKMTATFRNTGTNHLLLSFLQPHKPISTTTLSMWCVNVMKESGINVNLFASHSTRSPPTSKCNTSGLSFKEIAKSAGWLNEKTFSQFYDWTIQEDSRGIFKLFI